MNRFIQLHVLTAYPPANLNRDDTGRPKTALVGDALRLRISSQSLKRAWRKSDVFEAAIGKGHLGTRTKLLGVELHKLLIGSGASEKQAREWARAIAGRFGKLKADKKTDANDDLQIEQLAHVSPAEREKAEELAALCGSRKSEPTGAELELLSKPRTAVDIAMFGRMLANPESVPFEVEAAIQVAHAITVHRAAVEDDYFSAVDDLNAANKGAGHIDERGFGAGLFYLYICINRELLQDNLGGDAALTAQALDGLLHAVTQVAPTGMQNSFGSRAHASYLLAETGNQQPRSLVQAFLKPVKPYGDRDMLAMAVEALNHRCENFDKVYGACADSRCHFDVEKGEGSLAEIIAFVKA